MESGNKINGMRRVNLGNMFVYIERCQIVNQFLTLILPLTRYCEYSVQADYLLSLCLFCLSGPVYESIRCFVCS